MLQVHLDDKTTQTLLKTAKLRNCTPEEVARDILTAYASLEYDIEQLKRQADVLLGL